LNRLNWRDFLKQENPVASALMSKMGFDETERVQVKKECLRMIVNLKLDPARTRLLSGFVDSYLRLREEEQKRFEEETKKLPKKEREKVMEITTSWEEKGIEIGLKRGLKQGKQEGKQEGSANMILLVLKARFSKLSKRTESRIQKLPTNKLEELGKALFSFQDKRDLENWLNKMSGNNH
jgi:flagellar biosynthesis/type III secretory pathway protein FliH